MNVEVVVHEAEEGGVWGEGPALPGCASQGETMQELPHSLQEALDGCLSTMGPTEQQGSWTCPTL